MLLVSELITNITNQHWYNVNYEKYLKKTPPVCGSRAKLTNKSRGMIYFNANIPKTPPVRESRAKRKKVNQWRDLI